MARAKTDQPTLAGRHAPGPYDGSFFADITEGSLPSARIIAPLVQKLIPGKWCHQVERYRWAPGLNASRPSAAWRSFRRRLNSGW